MIHPTAIIHPKAQLPGDVQVGPYAIIDENVILGPGCVVGPYVYLTGQIRAGRSNHFHAGCVIGDRPQDLRFKGHPTGVEIGDHNTFREQVTIHRSNNPAEPTRLGSHNFLMAHAHIGHNSQVGSHVIIANGVLLAGHVEVGDRVFLSGNCLAHQFTRIGQFAFMQGGSAVSKDLAPFTMARGDNTICGLNTVGLRRAGFTTEQRLELRRLYHFLFRSGRNMLALLSEARCQFASDLSLQLINFISQSKRGIVTDPSRRRKAPLNESESE